MSRLGVVKGLAIAACVAVGCRFEKAEPLPRPQPALPSGGTDSEAPPSPGGEPSDGGKVSIASGGKEAEVLGGGGAGESSQAGESHGGAAQGGDGAGGEDGVLPTDCKVDGGCETKCEDQTHACHLTDPGLACEFKMFAGTTQQVVCGELTTVGQVNCGACGLVDFKVLFDGQNCWQGIPDCARWEFEDRLFRIVE